MTAIASKRRIAPAAPEGAEIALVRVAPRHVLAPRPAGGDAPDQQRVAFARVDAAGAGIWIGDPAAPRRVVESDGWRAEEILWSPDGRNVAYAIGGGPPPGGARRVGWADERGELGRIPGSRFAWTPMGNALVVVDGDALVRHALGSARSDRLATLEDDGDPHLPPRIAVSPDGTRIAVTCRRAEDRMSELWVVERDDAGPSARLVTRIPGAGAIVSPFWSPKGGTLAMHVVHLEQQRSAIIAVPKLEGEGVVLYRSELVDPGPAPVWAPSGKTIALLRTEKPRHEHTRAGPARLALLDAQSGALEHLTDPGEIGGPLAFLDERTLAAGGDAEAVVLAFDEAP